YETFNEQWIDIHVKNISNKLSELRIQTIPKKIKFAFQQYCRDLGFEMFFQGNQVATENDHKEYENNNIWTKSDLTMEIENKNEDDKTELKMNEIDSSSSKTQSFWRKYFRNGNVAKNVSKRTKDNKNQNVSEKMITKINDTKTSLDMWEKYFNGDSVARYVLRRVGDNKYQFLHKSCQEYYAAQKIILDIISWKPSI
ncbi:hypothetical protein RFI_02795, partial [Reticulomyxa filosa]